jgi:hypothetical protein
MSLIETVNDGPAVVSSTYWGSEDDRAGKLYASCEAGTVRLLLPALRLREAVYAARAAEYAILSRGPWPAAGLPDAVEIVLEDHSEAPYALYLSPASFDLLPAEPGPREEWVLAVWEFEAGKPRLAASLLCRWRRVPRLPWLEPWGAEGE